MPKAKLKIALTDLKKLRVAAEFSNVSIIKDGAKQIGTDAYVVVTSPSAGNYFELGRMFAHVTGNELDEPVKAESKGEPEPQKPKKAA